MREDLRILGGTLGKLNIYNSKECMLTGMYTVR